MNWIKVERWEDLPRNKRRFLIYWKDEIYLCAYDDTHHGNSFWVGNELQFEQVYLEIDDGRRWHLEQEINVDSTMVPQPTHYALIEPPKDVK